MDASISIPELAPFTELNEWYLDEPRFNSFLVGAFGGIALLLSAIGIYGLVKQSTSNRLREIGIRIAIGEPGKQLLQRLILSEMAPLFIGTIVGLAAAYLGRDLISSYLWGVQPSDPMSMLAAPALLLTVALVSLAVPVGRAVRTDPTITLRQE